LGQNESVRAVLVAAAAAAMLAAGCDGTAAPRAGVHVTAQPASLTGRQACERLRAVLDWDNGRADLPTLHYIADHVTASPRVAMDARDAVKDITHTGIAPIPLTLLRDDCAKAGVHIPAP
jgi:hypothetical protein